MLPQLLQATLLHEPHGRNSIEILFDLNEQQQSKIYHLISHSQKRTHLGHDRHLQYMVHTEKGKHKVCLSHKKLQQELSDFSRAYCNQNNDLP